MKKRVKITITATQQLLSELYGQGDYRVQQLGEGVWSYAYAFEHNGVRKVIRWGDVADNFERDQFSLCVTPLGFAHRVSVRFISFT